MINIEILRTHVRELTAQHGVSEKIVRAMIGAGLLPELGCAIEPSHKGADEPLPDYAKRLIRDAGALTSRDQCATLRRKLATVGTVSTVDMTAERVREASYILEDEQRPASVQNVAALVGGSYRSICEAFASMRSELSRGQRLATKVTLDVDNHHLDALIRCGLVDELRRGSACYRRPVDLKSIRARVTAAFRDLAPEAVDLRVVKDIAIIRSGLRLATFEHHSQAIEEKTTDYLLRLGVEPTVMELDALLAGDSEQHRAYLTGRARTRGDVPLPRRAVKGVWSAKDLCAALPHPVDKLYDTVLDGRRGSTRETIGSADFGRIILNPHAQLQVIGAVVTCHGARVKALRFAAEWGARSCANLATGLAGIDVTNPAQLAAGFAANRLVLKGLTDRNDIQRANRDIDGWRHAIRVCEDYLKKKDLPPALRTYLEAVRPAYPSGGRQLFGAVQAEMFKFNEDSKGLRDDELMPYLSDIPKFIGTVTDAHDQLEALRSHIKAEVAAAETAAGVDLLDAPIEREFRSDVRGTDGSKRTYTYHCTVHPWRPLIARTGWRRKKYPGLREPVDPFDQHPSDESLFENRYAVEMRDCTLDGKSVEYPLAIIKLHRDRAFWPPRQCPDETANELRCARLKEFGMSAVCLTQAGSGIGNFEGHKFGCAQRVRQELGIFLFPLEEAYHSSLVGALHMGTRSVEALRAGDLAQWNVGSGLETGYDENGEPFSILASISKRKEKPRKTPLTKRCDELADKLTTLASERFFQGGPIPHLRRAAYNGKGPEYESHIFCSRTAGLSNRAMNAHCRLLLVGNDGFRTHFMKYIWSKLSRDAGSTIEERRDEHGHTTDGMTEEYDVRTPDEEAKYHALRRDQLETRSQYLAGERESPLPDEPIETLRFRRKRLVNDIVFLEEEGAGVELDKANAALRILDAKIARVEAAR